MVEGAPEWIPPQCLLTFQHFSKGLECVFWNPDLVANPDALDTATAYQIVSGASADPEHFAEVRNRQVNRKSVECTYATVFHVNHPPIDRIEVHSML